jgi:hypothetical protein
MDLSVRVRNSLALEYIVSHMIYMLRRSGVRADSLEVDIVAISLFVASKLTAWMRPFQPPADLPLQLIF